MIIRFVAKNVFSFKEETEFNLFPNKTQRLAHHKISHKNIDFLRLSAVYGANGSGKSNLVKAISLLETLIENGKLISDIENIKFKLSDESAVEPISLGIEFMAGSKIYYYSITFDDGLILHENLMESNKEKDLLIFERYMEADIQRIDFFEGYIADEKNKLFVDVLAERLLQKDELLLTFLSSKYKNEFPDAKIVFDWFDTTLVIISPDAKPGGIAHILDQNNSLKEFANNFIPTLNTGISNLSIDKIKLEDFMLSGNKAIKDITEELRKKPGSVSIFTHSETGEELSIVYEKEEFIIKRLVTNHLNDKGKDVEFQLNMESDGTKRLIDYIPAFNGIINEERVYIIDEIERSIHPITIKEIITKISLDEKAKGQLIFTTHESCLLDQEILRPDEIWFAQKDVDGSSKLYSLSDFNIHNTANIENGYLNGRFGGIPFLSNLHDLNWHKYAAVSE